MLLPIGSDEEEQTTSSARQNLTKRLSQTTCIPQKRGHLQRIISIEEDHLPHLLQRDQLARSPLPECSETEETSDNEEMRNDPLMRNETPTSLRGRPVGKETSINVSTRTQKTDWLARNLCTGLCWWCLVKEDFNTLLFYRCPTFLQSHHLPQDESAPSLPDRLFKVVMVGNSSVGKTSLLRRFCDDSFHPGTSATVGTCDSTYSEYLTYFSGVCLTRPLHLSWHPNLPCIGIANERN